MSRAIVALLTVDAWLTMPLLPFEYQGRDTCPHRVLLAQRGRLAGIGAITACTAHDATVSA
jgi:hypothetical protein